MQFLFFNMIFIGLGKLYIYLQKGWKEKKPGLAKINVRNFHKLNNDRYWVMYD